MWQTRNHVIAVRGMIGLLAAASGTTPGRLERAVMAMVGEPGGRLDTLPVPVLTEAFREVDKALAGRF
jgi:hypothetical protein